MIKRVNGDATVKQKPGGEIHLNGRDIESYLDLSGLICLLDI